MGDTITTIRAGIEGVEGTDACLRLLNDIDRDLYQSEWWFRHAKKLADERELIQEDKDIMNERQYIPANRSDEVKFKAIADKAYKKRQKVFGRLPHVHVQLTAGLRFAAGLCDIIDGGGIDFEDFDAPSQELDGRLVTIDDTMWLLVESSAITRGQTLLAGGMYSVTKEGGRPLRDDLSVSANDPRAIVGIKITRSIDC